MSRGRFVPQHVIDRRMQANDDRYARAIRARCPRLAPAVVAFASVEIVSVEAVDDPDPFGPAPTVTVQASTGDTTAGYTTNWGHWTRRSDGRPVRLDLPLARRPR